MNREILDASVTDQELEELAVDLRAEACRRLRPSLRAKADLSGIVQQTLIEVVTACRAAVAPEGELRKSPGWVRQVLCHNIRDAVRRVTACCRDGRRERSLEAMTQPDSPAADWLAAQQSAVEDQLVRAERIERMHGALGRLPAAQRDALQLHFLQGYSLERTASCMGRSRGAVAGLLFRGLRQLRASAHDVVESGP